MSIASVEQHLIDTLKAAFGKTLKTVESLPADWDDETFRRVLRLAPGLFIVFGGGLRNDTESKSGTVVINARWGVVAATTHSSGELARRRGDKREIGAYEIIERASHALEGHLVPGNGQIEIREVENLFSSELEKQGAAVYSLNLQLPMYLSDDDDNGSGPTLDDFVTWHNAIDSTPDNGRDEADDTVTLEQSA